MKFLFFTLIIATSTLIVNASPTLIYSPDKRFVVAWDDSYMGSPIGEIRSILLREMPHGDTPFSLVTFPRDTRVYWSPDSKKCFIINGPDDGGPQTWLFIAHDSGSQPNAVKIDLLKAIQDQYFAHSHNIWRGDITQVAWIDNQTLKLNAFDNNGTYTVMVRMDALGKPVIQKLERSKVPALGQ
jgi:hypothetical protein